MRDRQILFNGAMVRAILEGRKTQTRRVIKPQPTVAENGRVDWNDNHWSAWNKFPAIESPYGQPGDRLWVKETFKIERSFGRNVCGIYTRTGDAFQKTLTHAEYEKFLKWKNPTGGKSSLFMFKSLARLWLEVVSIRVERLNEISRDDACAEGMSGFKNGDGAKIVIPRFQRLWDFINAKRGYSWDSNPWVWVVEFKRLEK